MVREKSKMWVLPTLSRSKQCAEVVDRIKAMGCMSPGVVFVNGSSHSEEYAAEFFDSNRLPQGWRLHYNFENIGALGALNSILRSYPEEKFYGFIGDDEFVETEKFDETLIAAAGDWDFSHGADGEWDHRRAQGYLCIGGKLARAVGYLAIPACIHWFGLDNMWETLAGENACGKVFCERVKIDNRHPYYKKGKMDTCYELGAKNIAHDHYEFSRWVHLEKDKAIERIKRARAHG